VVSEDDKKRFEWGKGGERIRARQGHSVEVELGYTPQSPPELLYHGTVAKFLVSIMAGGLLKGERHHVHLSADVETATRVGRRRGTPVIIVVDSSRMAAAGVEFFNTPNGVWLTDHVPPEYLRFPS
jgi:putative RNA 2'-phosphotransferase